MARRNTLAATLPFSPVRCIFAGSKAAPNAPPRGHRTTRMGRVCTEVHVQQLGVHGGVRQVTALRTGCMPENVCDGLWCISTATAVLPHHGAGGGVGRGPGLRHSVPGKQSGSSAPRFECSAGCGRTGGVSAPPTVDPVTQQGVHAGSGVLGTQVRTQAAQRVCRRAWSKPLPTCQTSPWQCNRQPGLHVRGCSWCRALHVA